MDLSGKNVLVFGSGVSGIGAADLLAAVGAHPIIYDGNESVQKEVVIRKINGGYIPEIYIGTLPVETEDKLDLVVVSPGVPTDIPLVREFYEKGIPVWGEVELAYQASLSRRVLAVTGTNGKTTTTALLGKILSDYEASVFVVGNIGTPYTAAALSMKEESVTVAEISSFQLETIQDFAPKVSAILNITEDHLDRHHTMEEYIRVKESITKNQTETDVCVLNHEDALLRAFGEQMTPRCIYFSSQMELGDHRQSIFLRDMEDGQWIIWKDGDTETPVVGVRSLRILGRHNYENAMAAVAMAASVGVPMESIRKSVCAFQAVAHRIEYVAEKSGVVYYNDSKGTNPDAAIKGIQAMDRPTYLIAGGYDKDSDYREWIRSFDGKVKSLILIGQTKEKIAQAAREEGFTKIVMARDLQEAIEICAERARPGEAVLLSPACASWGQFENYEQRGDMFKESVHKLR